MDTTVNKPIHYERMELHIDDQGVSFFHWNVPMTVTGVVNANTRLISFDEAPAHLLRRGGQKGHIPDRRPEEV